MEMEETLILGKFIFKFNLFLIRTTSGGLFNVTRSNFDYRENFKKSLRSYERSKTRNENYRNISTGFSINRINKKNE
jgi:hypothetical protein